MDLSDLWTVAGILLGFQFTIVLGRIQREVTLEDKAYEILNSENIELAEKEKVKLWSYWFTLADYLNLLAMTVLVVGVFLYPIVQAPKCECCIEHVTEIALKWFALALIFFLGYVYALIGHYKLFISRKYRRPRGQQHTIERTPRQEWITLIAVGIVAAVYLVFAFS